MTVAANLAASWQAFEHAGMLRDAMWSGTEAKVFLDAPGDVLVDGVASGDYSVVFRVEQWPGLREGDTVTVSGTAYRVRQVLALDDGMLARALLSTRRVQC